MSTTVIKSNYFLAEWSMDSKRTPQSCGGCKQLTTGLSASKPKCLNCVIAAGRK